MSTYTIRSYKDFRGGLNTAYAPDNVPENQLLQADNVDLSAVGGYFKRSGTVVAKEEYVEVGGLPSWCTRMREFYFDVIGEHQILCNTLFGVVKYDDNSVLAYPSINSDMAFFNGKVYKVSSVIADFQEYTGTGVFTNVVPAAGADLTGVQSCTRIVSYAGRLFSAGSSGADSDAMYYSEIGEPDNWLALNVVKLPVAKGEKITALYAGYHGALLVFTEQSVYAWSGTDPSLIYGDVNFVQIKVPCGTTQPDSIQRVGNKLFFFGDTDFYALVGLDVNNISSYKASANITPTIKGNAKLSVSGSFTGVYTMSAVVWEGKYMCTAWQDNELGECTIFVCFHDIDGGQTTANNDVIPFPWAIYKGIDAFSLLVTHERKLLISLFAYALDGVTKSFKILRMDECELNDQGEAIEMHVVHSPIEEGEFIREKKFRRGYMLLQQFEGRETSIGVTAWVDGVDTEGLIEGESNATADISLKWDVGKWDQNTWDFMAYVSRRFNIRTRGKRLELEVTSTEVDKDCFVYGYSIQSKVKKPERT